MHRWCTSPRRRWHVPGSARGRASVPEVGRARRGAAGVVRGLGRTGPGSNRRASRDVSAFGDRASARGGGERAQFLFLRAGSYPARLARMRTVSTRRRRARPRQRRATPSTRSTPSQLPPTASRRHNARPSSRSGPFPPSFPGRAASIAPPLTRRACRSHSSAHRRVRPWSSSRATTTCSMRRGCAGWPRTDAPRPISASRPGDESSADDHQRW